MFMIVFLLDGLLKNVSTLRVQTVDAFKQFASIIWALDKSKQKVSMSETKSKIIRHSFS